MQSLKVIIDEHSYYRGKVLATVADRKNAIESEFIQPYHKRRLATC